MTEQGRIPFPEQRDSSQDISRVSPQEAIEGGYSSLVIMPYSSNLHEYGPKRGMSHLSAFSKIATVVAARLFREGSFNNILLCGEDTFDGMQKDTTLLMYEMLQRLEIPISSIRAVDQTRNLNNTAFQAEALADHQKASYAVFGRTRKPYLIVDWEFHDKRVRNNTKAYGLSADTVTVEDLLRNFFPTSDLKKYREVLNQFVEREKDWKIKLLGGGKARIGKMVTRRRGGSLTDIQVASDEYGNKSLKLLDTTGRKRMKVVPNSPEF